MDELRPLDVAALCWRCDPQQFDFETTESLDGFAEIPGQSRAMQAVQFGIEAGHRGYNLYLLGPSGMGKRMTVEHVLERQAAQKKPPSDWCYVNNFDEPYRPRAMELPAGWGVKLDRSMRDLMDDLRTAILAALESDEYRSHMQEIEQEFKERHDRAFEELAQRAVAQNVRIVRTPGGFVLAPLRNDEILGPDEFTKLPDAEKQQIERVLAGLHEQMEQLIEQVPRWNKEARDKMKEVNRQATGFAIGHLLARVKEEYASQPAAVAYLDAVQRDVIEHADEFHRSSEEPVVVPGISFDQRPSFHRYRVNVVVDNSRTQGAPVVREDHPTYQNLIGRVEHESQMGALVTDFTLIKAGALHRANGGYLLIDAYKLLTQPFAWEGLKRALQAGDIRIESLGQALSLVSTVSLEPEPIPLDVKVVLLGDRLLYYLLYQFDPDFADLFKVAADFEERVDRSADNCALLARSVAALGRRERLHPLDRTAVARVIEFSARTAGDSTKLSAHMRTIADIVREADHWAQHDGATIVAAKHIQQAIDQQIYRCDRIRQHWQEETQRGTILIDTQGERIGQVNGLSVIDLGNFSFGHPTRITATARLGKGEVIDIEREVELGGAIHSKGVLILSSFLASRYAKSLPLSLSASLVFEQSYGLVEGDSASVAELCSLLSVLAEAPIRQNLAVTGSVNQHGQVQAIGGVNEKIEGFFDVCRARGLTGDQGVLIPAANVPHLMLRHDVVETSDRGEFHIYPVSTIDQAIALLTGAPAGELDPEGAYPSATINGRVTARLQELSNLRQKYSAHPEAVRRDE